MFCAVHSVSISTQSCLKILDIFEGLKQIHKQKTKPTVFPPGWGNPWTSVCEACWAMGLWRRKCGRLFLVSALLETMTSNVLRRAARAGRANGSGSNYREQGDPVGMATLRILFPKNVLPYRYMNPGKGLVQTHTTATNFVSVFIMQAHKGKYRHRGRSWEKTESCFLYTRRCSFTRCEAGLR